MRRTIALIVLFLLASVPAARVQADPSTIWNIESGKCMPHFRDSGDPAPCALVDPEGGYVVLKDLVGTLQYLLMPTARITGIESPAILAPGVPNYWDEAWRARRFSEARAGHPLPRDIMSLTVNSPTGRSQNQLHIHIDCVRADVREALAANRDAIGPEWAALPVTLVGQPWRALRLNGDTLGDANPFRLLAEKDPAAAADMGAHTLAAVAITWSDGQPGFVVLDGKADPLAGNRASAEELQDHGCALAASSPASGPSPAPVRPAAGGAIP